MKCKAHQFLTLIRPLIGVKSQDIIEKKKIICESVLRSVQVQENVEIM